MDPFVLINLLALLLYQGYCLDDGAILNPNSARTISRISAPRPPPSNIPVLLTASLDGRITALKPDTGSVQWYCRKLISHLLMQSNSCFSTLLKYAFVPVVNDMKCYVQTSI